MNKLKLFLRLILKIPLTPFVVLVCGGGLIMFYGIIFFEWMYDDPNPEYMKKEKDWLLNLIKKWFTTI